MDEFAKSQGVRLVDVFLLGPFMVWAGARGNRLPGWARALLVVSGVATVAYNGTNYLKIEEARKSSRWRT